MLPFILLEKIEFICFAMTGLFLIFILYLGLASLSPLFWYFL